MQYGLLTYSRSNIGNEIQSLAAMRFLPRADIFLDCDAPGKWNIATPTKLIMNGCLRHFPEDWLICHRLLRPLFVSFHLSSEHASSLQKLLSDDAVAYYKEHEPIGCKDIATQQMLLERGVKAYFSGCLTLALKAPRRRRSSSIVLVDVPVDIANRAPEHIRSRILTVSHVTNTPLRFQYASRLLDIYSTASLVLTSRLHCALPCVAFGTPVLFIRDSFDEPRFDGMSKIITMLKTNDIISGKSNIQWESTADVASAVGLRVSLESRCKDFVKNTGPDLNRGAEHFYDNAK